jgi:hypothetical protein
MQTGANVIQRRKTSVNARADACIVCQIWPPVKRNEWGFKRRIWQPSNEPRLKSSIQTRLESSIKTRLESSITESAICSSQFSS